MSLVDSVFWFLKCSNRPTAKEELEKQISSFRLIIAKIFNCSTKPLIKYIFLHFSRRCSWCRTYKNHYKKRLLPLYLQMYTFSQHIMIRQSLFRLWHRSCFYRFHHVPKMRFYTRLLRRHYSYSEIFLWRIHSTVILEKNGMIYVWFCQVNANKKNWKVKLSEEKRCLIAYVLFNLTK